MSIYREEHPVDNIVEWDRSSARYMFIQVYGDMLRVGFNPEYALWKLRSLYNNAVYEDTKNYSHKLKGMVNPDYPDKGEQ